MPPPPRGWLGTFSVIDRQDSGLVLTLVTPETIMMDNVMRVVTEALNRKQEAITRQQEPFMKMMETGTLVTDGIRPWMRTLVTGPVMLE